MKYIKKVDVTQLVTNTGTIIDSMSSGDDQHTNAPSIDAVKNYVDSGDTKNYRMDMVTLVSTVTNTTTTPQDFGPAIALTSTGKNVIIIGTAVCYISGGGNVNLYVKVDDNYYDIGKHDNTNRERITGFKIIENLTPGIHIMKLAFACSQSNKTATIPAYVSSSLIAFEI